VLIKKNKNWNFPQQAPGNQTGSDKGDEADSESGESSDYSVRDTDDDEIDKEISEKRHEMKDLLSSVRSDDSDEYEWEKNFYEKASKKIKMFWKCEIEKCRK